MNIWAGRCTVCGCTEADCRECIRRTGKPCSWVHHGREKPLCSACADVPRNPAPYSEMILDVLAARLEENVPTNGMPLYVLDPFAGTGRIHWLAGPRIETFGVEQIPEWAGLWARTAVGDATSLEHPAGMFGAICVSPAYGSRMADSHNAKDDSTRMTYTHRLGRKLPANNTGNMHFRDGKSGEPYRAVHRAAWAEAVRVLQPNGVFILNVSNFLRGPHIVPVSEWHLGELARLGLMIEHVDVVRTRRMRLGANAAKRFPVEYVFTLRKLVF